ncbi:lipopolysaccharide-induced tumor necrosis factor-alpha factor homolog [Lucilia cuprina]|uniref:lipopolysaccharide-induced tumor necrosis factor-alpha factor homolog n=1 Tax=Lucilia cuprina TaxID=7375 RepID=UPI001F055AB8|nr:lipopolysaccharide-induced tumor necrosis factor-alpha factor homolog [Lucilia cuprina]
MDQKHAMLYSDTGNISVDQHSSSAAAIGLPIEPPPTYDAATREATPSAPLGWTTNTPDIHYPTSLQYSPHINHHHLPVIVEQSNFPLPVNQQQPQPPLTQQQQQTDGVPITIQPSVNLSSKLGPNPSTVTCPNCGANKTTRMCYTPNTRTHFSALLLCLVGWCCCACIVPYCMNSCRTGNHYCSKCNAFLGAYHPGTHRRYRRR